MESIQKLKRNLVAEMLSAPGRFREAVEEVRTYWRIDDPPLRLPPESEDILLPPGLDKPGDLSALRVVWSNHPLLPPVSHGSRHRLGDIKTWPTSWSTTYRNLKRQWELDLRDALRAGSSPEEYLEDRNQSSKDKLPLYRFAAACVLYEPPETDLIAFANYGGASPIKGWLTERQLKEQRIMNVIDDALNKMAAEKMWEHRQELPDDYGQARYEILNLLYVEMQAEEDRIREDYEIEMKLNPPHLYYVAFDPAEDSNEDVQEKVSAIRAESGSAPRGGRPRMDILTAMQCAILYCNHNPTDSNDKRVKTWTYPKLAAKFKEYGVRNTRSAIEHVKYGKKLLQAREKIRKNHST